MRRWIFWLGVVFLGILPTTSAQQNNTLTVQGRIVQGTANAAPLPSNLPIELQIVDPVTTTVQATLTAITSSDGRFTFENVPRHNNAYYLLFATHGGIRQYTQPLTSTEVGFVSFPLYEVNSQYNGIEIVSGTMRVDEYAVIGSVNLNLAVILDIEIANLSDHILYDHANDASFRLELPVGAFGVSEVIEAGTTTTHLRIEEGIIPVVYDTLPLVPQWPNHTIHVTYLLPYPKEAIIDQPFPTPIENFEVWLPKDTVYLDSNNLELTDNSRTIDPNLPDYLVYQLMGRLPADTHLIFTLSGQPTETVQTTTQHPSNIQPQDQSISPLLLIAGVVVILGLGGGFWWRRRLSAQSHKELQ